MNLVFRGHAVMGVGSRELELKRGDVLLIRPGQDHEMLHASPDLELFVAAVTPPLAERCRRGPWPTDALPLALSSDEASDARARLASLDGASAPHAAEHVVGALFESCHGRIGRGHPVTRKALQATSEAPAISAQALAQRLRVHPSELGRHFQRDLGLRFVEFRARLRLMRFIEQVDRGQTLTRAASLACFGSYTQCHRIFQRYLGCSPQEYFAGQRHSVDEQLATAAALGASATS